MMQNFTYLPPQIDIHDATLSQAMTNGLSANLLLIAEELRDPVLAMPEFAPVATQIALGQKAPYSLVQHNSLQLVVFMGSHPVRDHALYKQARSWVVPLAGLKIERMGVHLEGFDEGDRALLAELALACLLAANVPMPSHKHCVEDEWRYQQIAVSPRCVLDLARIYAEAEGNGMARHLAVSPASDLTARSYREWVRQLAQVEGWQWFEYDQAQLAERGAGAFIAVARGSEDNQAAMVKLSYCPPNPVRRVALVGKGICHDSGGYNLKVAGSMYGMHLDMGGSAVALGALYAISRASLPAGSPSQRTT